MFREVPAPARVPRGGPILRTAVVTTLGMLLLVVIGPARLTPQAQNADESVVLVGAGDIANCELLGGARATASLLDTIQGTIFTLGDHAYPKGTAKELEDCYGPTCG